jgi:hypothetical protein
MLKKEDKIIALEIKSGKKKTALPGIKEFSKKYDTHKKLLLGKGWLELKEFFVLFPIDLF